MFEKTFSEMLNVDVSKYLKAREENSDVKYLPWAACKMLLHENGAETVMFWPVPGPDGSTLRKSDAVFGGEKKGNRCYEVLVHIQVDGLQWETTYPVLNGNSPVRDDTMNQLRLHNAIRRAFVKGVAERTGLGFKLWLKDDDLPDAEVEEDLTRHSMAKIKERCQQLVTDKLCAGFTLEMIADRLGMDADTFRAQFALYNQLARFEKTIMEMEL